MTSVSEVTGGTKRQQGKRTRGFGRVEVPGDDGEVSRNFQERKPDCRGQVRGREQRAER